MIPATWIPYRRAGDNELLGYLRPVDGGTDRFIPVTVLGHLLDTEADEFDTQQVLDMMGRPGKRVLARTSAATGAC